MYKSDTLKPYIMPSSEGTGCKVYRYNRSIPISEYVVQLTCDITESFDYADLIQLLRIVGTNDVVKIILQGTGGDCHGCVSLINAMQTCAAHVICETLGPCYSAHSTIALAGDNLIMHENSILMFHDFSTRSAGKSSEIELDILTTKKWIHSYMQRIHYPFLTKKECNELINGKDLYIFWNHPDIQERLQRKFAKTASRRINIELNEG